MEGGTKSECSLFFFFIKGGGINDRSEQQRAKAEAKRIRCAYVMQIWYFFVEAAKTACQCRVR